MEATLRAVSALGDISGVGPALDATASRRTLHTGARAAPTEMSMLGERSPPRWPLRADHLVDLLSPRELRRRLIELPTERAIALGRLTLAATCVAAVGINPPSSAAARDAIASVLSFYVLFSIVLVALPRLPTGSWFHVLQHGIDIFTTWALIFFTEVSTSPYFPLFVFSLVVGLLRWNWRGALTTAALLAGVLLLLPSEFLSTPDGLQIMNADLSRVVVRGGFLLVCGAMLAYLGAHRERTRRRFAQLASWPAGDASGDETEALGRSLAHAAMVLQALRVVLIWEEQDEPHRNVLSWANGKIEHTLEVPGTYGDLIGSTASRVSFCGPEQETPTLSAPDTYRLDFDLQQRFGIRTAATAAFEGALCTARVFMLDRPNWIDEDAPIVSIIAQRLGIELEDRILRRQLQEGATLRERVRLGRDLHDGVLQGLAAASMQLKVLATQGGPERAQPLEAVRGALANEARRIRGFVEESRTIAAASSTVVAAQDDLGRRARALGVQWGCAVSVTVDPPGLMISASNVRHLDHLLAEGVSNAVRHGRASWVAVELSRSPGGLLLKLKDNGSGFAPAPDLGDSSVTRPLSLRSRAEDLGGSLSVESSSAGADIRIVIPT